MVGFGFRSVRIPQRTELFCRPMLNWICIQKNKIWLVEKSGVWISKLFWTWTDCILMGRNKIAADAIFFTRVPTLLPLGWGQRWGRDLRWSKNLVTSQWLLIGLDHSLTEKLKKNMSLPSLWFAQVFSVTSGPFGPRDVCGTDEAVLRVRCVLGELGK